MDIRVGCTVIARTMDKLYKQLVEYCCSSLLNSLVNYTTHVPYCCSNYLLEQHSQFAYFSKALSRLSSSGDYVTMGTSRMWHGQRAKGMMSTIGCAKVVSVSTSCSRCYSLTQSSLFSLFFVMFLDSCLPYCCLPYSYIQQSQIHVSIRFTTYIIPFHFLKSLPKCSLSSSLRLLQITRELDKEPSLY